MTAELLLWMLAIHFVADFLLQSDWMAQNKSKRNLPLLVHVLVYGACFLYFGFLFALLTAALHFVVDFGTSRASSALWKRGKVHYFFVVIGADQLIHYFCLYGTWRLLKL